jgi:hypothetical protein
MIPPLTSATINGDDILGRSGKNDSSKTQNTSTEDKTGGRPEKADNEKSEKTIANKESMN